MDPILAQIEIFAFNWAPYGWALCNGQALSVVQNQALYSLLGTNFGYNTINVDFKLPDLRGKVILGQGLTNFPFASSGGNASTTLVVNNLPIHNHAAVLTLTNATTTINANATPGTANTPSTRANSIGTLAADKGTMYNNVAPNVPLNVAGNTVGGTVAIGNTGANEAFSNMPPYCVLNACIATSGLYPSRS